MNDYQKEQFETLNTLRQYLVQAPDREKRHLLDLASPYLSFRKETASFLTTYFGEACTRTCYENRISACCSKDGIITFFADAVINALLSTPKEVDALFNAIRHPRNAFKCIYLGESGCLWHLKPIVCEMFLCDTASRNVFADAAVKARWDELEKEKKAYTWPDRPVLFDDLEQFFIHKGIISPLMYINHSPGLIRVRELAKKKGTYQK